jgi:MSHA biogenesis protein MshQ
LKATNNGPAALSGSMQIVDTLPTGLSYFSASGTGWTCSANGQIVTCNWSGSLANGAVAPDLLLTASIGAGVTGSVTNTAILTGTANDNVSGNNTASFTSGNFTPAYIFTTGVCADGVALGQAGQTCSLASWSPQIAGQSKTGIYITAVNSAGVPTRLSSGSSTAVGFQFGMSCSDPIANAGVQATFSAIATALPLCAGSGAQPSTWSASSSLTFAAGSPSVATSYTFNYADVGQVELYMRNAIATTQMGSSGNFVVKPAGFVLTGIKCTTADAANCGAGALAMATAGDNPGAATVAGATFIRAGHPFSVTVTALTASGKAKADAGNTVNCTSTPLDCTPNFGKEVTPEGVKLAPTNVISGMVTPPDIAGNFGSFSGGIATGAAFIWDEVGIITLTATINDADYLAEGNVTGTVSGNVGRFYPNHFETTLTPGCGSAFTYSGQPFPLRIVAYKVGGAGAAGITANYGTDAGFSKTTTISGVGATGSITGGAPQFSNGATPVLTDAAVLRPTFTFTTSPSASVSVAMRAVDTDGVSSSAVGEGATIVRSGRVRMLNAYGSELLNLPVFIALEYVSSISAAIPPVTTWSPNTLDTCTTLSGSNFSFAFPAGTAAKPNNLAACETALTVSGAAPNQKLSLGRPCTGVPCAGNTGWARITLNLSAAVLAANSQCTAVGGAGASDVPGNMSWLMQGGANPSAQVTFGVYKSPLIYRRENY